MAACVTQCKSSTTGAIVEVMATHKTEGESLASRIECVGGGNVWEVGAMGVLRQQKRLTLTTDTIYVPSLLILKDCAECARESREKKERWQKQLAIESEERSRQFEESKRKFDQKKQEDREKRQRADTTVVLTDENTLRRNGVLMRRFCYKPGDSIDHRYGWARATKV